MLEVEGVENFRVCWHLASDLKTLKCMYNISKGGNSKTPCLYCMDQANILDPSNHEKIPSRHLNDPNFEPILNIPLNRVHECMLHALCRIIEKLVYLYIEFAWKVKDKRH